jgi:hypothetical protein
MSSSPTTPYQTDTRDRERHLLDAVVLLAVIDDPFAEREQFAGSDKSRLVKLSNHLSSDARDWERLPPDWRSAAQAALRLLIG